MLEEPADELFGGKGHAFPLSGITLLIPECDLSIFQLLDTVVCEGDPIDVWRQVFNDFLTGTDGFAVNDPLLCPYFILSRGLCQRAQP